MRSQRGSGYVECIDRHLLTLALQVKITPISSISHIQLLCALLEALIIPANTPPDSPREQYEIYFVFALIWAYGSALFHDGQQDSKAEFSKFFLTQFTLVKFPDNASVFDVFVDPTTAEFALWTEMVPKFELDPDIPLQVRTTYEHKKKIADFVLTSHTSDCFSGLSGPQL